MNIILVEDESDSARIIASYLQKSPIAISAILASGEECLKYLAENPLPDIVLMDLALPGMSGIEATAVLRQRFSGVDVVALTNYEDPETIINAIKAGACGYILKPSSQAELISALQEIRRGGSFLSGRVARRILETHQEPKDPAPPIETLSGRESEILHLLVYGFSYKEIADKLQLSVFTVNSFIRRIYKKLEVNSRGEAVAKAVGLKRNGV